MLERAVYLRKPIEHFLNDEDLEDLKPSKKEWDQCELLLTILLPFKKTSDRLQETKRPAIDAVFWSYETLFNEIDQLQTILSTPTNKRRSWVQEVAVAVEKMASKLRKYYKATDKPYVYSDGQILEPLGKLVLFDQESWDQEDAEKYSKMCRARYVRDYEPSQSTSRVSTTSTVNKAHPLKRKIAEIDGVDDEEEEDDYRIAQRNRMQQGGQNQFDRYIQSPTSTLEGETTLDWWRRHAQFYPDLARMARDTLAVPATGAGVEREFSKSGKVATWARSRLNTGTITEIMMFKNFLARKGQELENWEGSDLCLGIAEELIDEAGVPKKWRKRWWLDRRNRLM